MPPQAGRAAAEPEPVKHGFFARHPYADEASGLREATSRRLNWEIAPMRVAARQMLRLFETERTLRGKIALANVILTPALRVASRLTLLTQATAIKSKLGTRSIAQLVAKVAACRREGCESRA